MHNANRCLKSVDRDASDDVFDVDGDVEEGWRVAVTEILPLEKKRGGEGLEDALSEENSRSVSMMRRGGGGRRREGGARGRRRAERRGRGRRVSI